MKFKEVKRFLATLTVTTAVASTVLTGCGSLDEVLTEENLEELETIVEKVDEIVETGKKVVLVEDEVTENREIGTVQSKENIEAETDVEQAYDDFLEEQTSEKLEEKAEFTVVPFQTTFYVSSDTNVYEKPDSTSTVVGKVVLNTEIVTTGKVQEVDWYKFQLDGKDAFISNSFLSDKKMELEVVKEPETKAEQEKAANDFQEQIKQDPNYSTGGSIEEFVITGDGSNWDDGFVPSGRDIIVH